MKRHSFFFPLALIAAGSLWLLTGMGIIPSENLWALTHYLPFLLIGLGLGLILSAYWNYGRLAMSVLVVAGAVLAVVFAPQLGWAGSAPFGWNFDIGDEIGGGIKGSGIIESETRDLDDFTHISLSYPAKVTVTQGDEYSIKITGDDNLLPQISTDIEDGTLIVRNEVQGWKNRIRPTTGLVIELTVVDLNRIDINTASQLFVNELETDNLVLAVGGAGDISITDLTAKSLDVILSGAGSIDASGKVDSLDVTISGFGEIDASNLETKQADVTINGSGSTSVWVANELDVNINGAGNVRYYGDPVSVRESINGAGSVSPLGDK